MSFVDSRMNGIIDAFANKGFSISVQPEFIILEKSRYEFSGIVNKIVGLNICTLISSNRVNDNIVFTLTPYRIPDTFEPECLRRDEIIEVDYKSFSEIQFALFTNSVGIPPLIRFIKAEENFEIADTKKIYRSEVGSSLHRFVGTNKWDGKPILNASALMGNLLAVSSILTLTGSKYVDLQDIKKKRPLNRAISCKNKENGFKVARELISFGANIHYMYKNRTTFKWALLKKNYSIVLLLVKSGAKAKEITNMVLFILGQFESSSIISHLPNELRNVIGVNYLTSKFC